MDGLINIVTRQRLLVLSLTLFIIGLGIISWMRLPLDAFPDVSNVQVMILTEAPGLAPIEVERQISFPIELGMNGLPGVREVRSLSRAALSQVVVVFDDDSDVYLARQLAFERLTAVREQLPEGLEPELGPISTGLGEIYQYTLSSKTRSPMELRTIQDWLIAPRLKTLAGVNEVNSFGGFVKQYQIEVDPDALSSYGIQLQAVVRAVSENNANAGGSYILRGWEQSYVRSVGLVRSIEDLEEIVLYAEDGTPVLLRDVAHVRIGPETRQGAVTRDGNGETVAGMVIMLRGENSKLVVDRVRQEMPRIQASLPEDVQIDTFYDRMSLILDCIDTVSAALLQGGVLVIIVLFLFMWNLRAALTVALSLPLTALLCCIAMDFADLTANLMSLGGLAIAIGMVVDGTIVVTENVVRHMRTPSAQKYHPVEIARFAVSEVARPVTFAVLVIVVVFLPLLTLEGYEGKMFRPLALSMVFAMAASLGVALIIIPAITSVVFRPTTTREGGLGPFLAQLYQPLLDSVLRNRKKTLAAAAFLLIAAIASTPLLGTEFLPALDEGALAINVVRLSSASLEGSVEVATALERRLRAFPEVETVVSKTGRAEISEDPMGPDQSDIYVILRPESEWTTGRTKAQLIREMERSIVEIPGLRPSFSQPIALRVNELVSGIKADVAIKLFGDDLELLRETAERIGQLLGTISGASDVRVEQTSGFRQLEIEIDRRAIARYRLNVAEINSLIETAIGGRVASEIAEGQRRFAVNVRFPEERRNNAEAIGSILIRTPEGAQVPLSSVTHIHEVEAPAQVSRENGSRRIVVECNVRDRDLGSFVAELKQALRPLERELPSGYHIDVAGQFENQQRAMARLMVVVPLSIALVFLLLASAFRSFLRAFIVIMNLPFALVGGVFVLIASDINLSVSAAIGFIALFGIAVENGVVLVSFFDQLLAEGCPAESAVRKGCLLRIRPLLMTTMTTLLGLTPMLLARGAGAEIQRPLAAVVLGGLFTSTLLTLVVLPTIYLWFIGRTQKRELVAGETMRSKPVCS